MLLLSKSYSVSKSESSSSSSPSQTSLCLATGSCIHFSTLSLRDPSVSPIEMLIVAKWLSSLKVCQRERTAQQDEQQVTIRRLSTEAAAVGCQTRDRYTSYAAHR